MADHTPGPWEAVGNTVYARTVRHFERPIARVGAPLEKNDNRVDEVGANTLLISCAPDLLNTMFEIRRITGGLQLSDVTAHECLAEIGAMAGTAIRKATEAYNGR